MLVKKDIMTMDQLLVNNVTLNVNLVPVLPITVLNVTVLLPEKPMIYVNVKMDSMKTLLLPALLVTLNV